MVKAEDGKVGYEIMTDLIKVKFLKGNTPVGREYTYKKPEGLEVKVGDKVQINEDAVGVVTGVDVPEVEVATFADKLKSIVGIAKPSKTQLIMQLINEYGVEHDLALTCGAEYIMQSDEAQEDALDLVCKIFDLLSEEQEV